MSCFYSPHFITYEQLCLQYGTFGGFVCPSMALALVDHQGEAVHQCHRRTCLSPFHSSLSRANEQYWVLFGSVVSSVFAIVWEWNLFVAHYGTFIQFTDSSGLSSSSTFGLSLSLMIVFSWLPVIDETVVLACQVFNLERSYRLNGRKIIVPIVILPFM